MTNARRIALDGLIDHAPLFPPAALPIDDAVPAHAAARAHRSAWLVGRLAWPAGQLGDLEARLPDTVTAESPWPVTVLLSDPTDAAAVPQGGRVAVEQVETRLVSGDDPAKLDAALDEIGLSVSRAFEIGWGDEMEAELAVVAEAGAVAKVRCGGADPSAVPSPEALARFLCAATEQGVAFKATAGLHHPFAHGDGDSFQHGFVALLAATAAAQAGHATDVVAACLTDKPSSFGLTDDGLRWRDLWVDADGLAQVRAAGFRSFGSCSFEEPENELEELGWLT